MFSVVDPLVKASNLPADAFAYTPDKADPSTWRLPLWAEGGTGPDARRVGAAIAALGKGFRGQKVQLPADAVAGVKAKVRAAWKTLNPDATEVPAVIAKGISGDDPDDDADGDLEDASEADVGGVMIAFGFDQATAALLAVEDGEPLEELHLTLAYLGSADDLDEPQVMALLAAVTRFSVDAVPLCGEVTGAGIFVGDDTDAVAVALVDCPGLEKFRARLLDYLRDEGLEASDEHGFIPHITLAYGDADSLAKLPLPPSLPLAFASLSVCIAGEVHVFPLYGGRFNDDCTPYLMAKADDERRFTLAPLYVPGIDDSHQEWVTDADLQDAVWDYVKSEDRSIRLQHLPDTVAGEWVEIVTWPFPLEAEMATGDGAFTKVTLPANTVYQGVIWEPWAYELVKKGKLNGMSMGGEAVRVE